MLPLHHYMLCCKVLSNYTTVQHTCDSYARSLTLISWMGARAPAPAATSEHDVVR